MKLFDAYSTQKVHTNLHLVLSMSPVGEKFRERCRFHPAILNCTTIDWYNDWSEIAMNQVSMSFLETVEFKLVYKLRHVLNSTWYVLLFK